MCVIHPFARVHQRKKEGETYSPREAEIIETKCKLDQLIAVADLELKQEKVNRWGILNYNDVVHVLATLGVTWRRSKYTTLNVKPTRAECLCRRRHDALPSALNHLVVAELEQK